MKKNVGAADRVIRLIIGLALLSLLFVIDGPWSWIGLVGLIPLFTAAVGWCPLYLPFGINTCKTKA